MNKKALIESAAKTFFGMVPYGGQLLTELFFDYRSRIKQDRLNSFVEQVISELEQHDIHCIPLSLQESEEFSDLFESVVRRTLQNGSAKKRKRLKDVFVNYIVNPTPNDYRESFLDIIERINETQISMLLAHDNVKPDFQLLVQRRDYFVTEMSRLNNQLPVEERLMNANAANNYHDYVRQILNMDHQLKEAEAEMNLYAKIRTHEYYNVEQEEYLFLLQDLQSRGLMIDLGLKSFDTKPFETMGITSFGSKFLAFVFEDC